MDFPCVLVSFHINAAAITSLPWSCSVKLLHTAQPIPLPIYHRCEPHLCLTVLFHSKYASKYTHRCCRDGAQVEVPQVFEPLQDGHAFMQTLQGVVAAEM
jgi:hypothetical protein